MKNIYHKEEATETHTMMRILRKNKHKFSRQRSRSTVTEKGRKIRIERCVKKKYIKAKDNTFYE